MAPRTFLTSDERRNAILAGELIISGGSDDDEKPAPLRQRLGELRDILADEEVRKRLTDAEVGAARDALKALHAEVKTGASEVQPTDTEVLSSIAECMVATYLEAGGRFTLAEATSAEVADIEAIILADPEAEAAAAGDDDAEDDDAEGEDDDAEDDAEAGAEADADAELTATGTETAPDPVEIPRLSRIRERDPRPDVPAIAGQGPAGQTLVTMLDGRRLSLSEYYDHVSRVAGSTLGRANEHITLGKVALLPPGAPRIDARRDGAEAIARKLDAAVGAALDPRAWNRDGTPGAALLASGGWGTPAPVVYDLAQISVADRPVLNALPGVGSERGGLTWVRPPKYSDVTQGGPSVTTAATGVWTSAIDTTPGGTTKSKQVVPVGSTATVQLDAIYQQLQEGVLLARAFPEWISAWGMNTNAAWAEEAERHLLDAISAATITKHITRATLGISATRELVSSAIELAAGERNRQRMSPTAMVRALYPSWVLDLVQVDLIRSGTNMVDANPLVVARDYFTGLLRSANINASFYIDSRTGASQKFADQADAAVLTLFRTHVEWYMWHEGAFVVGTGGELNLGIVRDSTLVNTNDFRLFSESFENIYDRGIWAYRVRQEVCPNGMASGTLDLHTLCTAS